MKIQYGSDWQILLSKEPAEIAIFEGATGEAEGPIPELLFQASTLETPIYAQPENYQSALAGTASLQQLEIEDQEIAVLSNPLYDFSGNIIGVIDIISDRTAVVQQQNSHITISIILFVISLAVVGVGIYFIVTITTRPIETLTNMANAVSAGDLTQTVQIESQDELGILAQTLNNMTIQLRETLEGLEQQVSDRTRALETSSEVGRRLSTILDQRELIRQVVEQVQTAFDYYYTHIYLFDDKKENLLMMGGTGEAGQIMLERGHSIPKGRGLVGRAADTNLPVLVPNVERSIGYEIITAETVAEVYERESTLEATIAWYDNHISKYFTDIRTFAERVAQRKASGGPIPKLGYVLYGLNDFLEMMKFGAEEAAKSLGIEVEVVSAGFDNDQGIRLFREMIAKRKDGLIVTPLIPDDWVVPIQEAVEAGIPVLTANLRCPDSASSAWFGQNSYQSGLILARELQKALTAAGKTSGEIIVASAREVQELNERYAGLKQGLQDSAYALSEFYNVPLDDEAQNLAGWEQLAKDNPAMVAAVGLASVDLPSLVRIKKRTNTSWIAAGYDITVEVLDAIRDGTAQVTIGQHPYLQGYLPVLALGQHFIDGMPLKNWIVDSWQSNPLLPETQAEAAVPIAMGENVVGVLDVQDNQIDGLAEEDVDLLQSIANQVASALQNARAYQQTQQQVAREALIANINQQIQGTTDIEEALQVAVRELGRTLGTSTSVKLNTPPSGNDHHV
jgi:simple sugar transport system substrate-binding protein